VGVARVGARTKDLAKRIGRGEIAVIDHRDLDRIAAESLLAAGSRPIVNADHSISGRYPNGGPERVVRGARALLDAVGERGDGDRPGRRSRRDPRRRAVRNGEKLVAGSC